MPQLRLGWEARWLDAAAASSIFHGAWDRLHHWLSVSAEMGHECSIESKICVTNSGGNILSRYSLSVTLNPCVQSLFLALLFCFELKGVVLLSDSRYGIGMPGDSSS